MKEKKALGDILSTATIAVMFIVILLLVMFSAAAYNHATGIQNENNDRRALLAYVTSCIKNDSAGTISRLEEGGAAGISIKSGKAGFERRIYLKDGTLLEEYAEPGTSVSPEDALEIGKTKVFEVSVQEPGLLKIETDSGASYVSVAEARKLELG